MGNIKDVNLLNKEIKDINEELERMKKDGGSSHRSSEKNGNNIEWGSESVNNINKEILKNREMNDKMRE